MREVEVLEDAVDEAVAAAAHYEMERPGLGFQFQETLQESFSLPAEDILPLTAVGASFSARGVRKLVLRRFPFSIIAREIDAKTVQVVAIAHHSRRPGYWLDRLST